MEKLISSKSDFRDALRDKLVLFYFSSENCSVCKSLQPQVKDLVTNEFPLVDFYRINSELNTGICTENFVFSFPSILVFAEGKETLRYSRIIPIGKLRESLTRLYELIFN